MLKTLAILAAFCTLAMVGLLAGQTAPFGPPKQGIAKSSDGQIGKTQAKSQSGDHATPNFLPPSPQPATPTCDEACQQGRQNIAIQGKLELFTGLLALVGFLQVGGMVWQALLLRQTRGDIHAQVEWMRSQVQEMRAQTAVSQTSSDIALLNTKALIAAERAWIVVDVESPAPGKFNFIARNVGRTPAKIHSVWSSQIITHRDKVLQIPPDEKTNDTLLGMAPCLIPPTATLIVLRCDIAELDKRHAFGPNVTFSQGFSDLRFYGRVVYFDIFESDSVIPHETKWLYWQIPIEGGEPIPDPLHTQYNTYT